MILNLYISTLRFLNDKLLVHNLQFLRNGCLKEITCPMNGFEKYYNKDCQKI